MTNTFKRRSLIKSALASIPSLILWPKTAVSQMIPFAYWRAQNTPPQKHTLWMWGDAEYDWAPSTLNYPSTICSSSPVQLPGSWLQVSSGGDFFENTLSLPFTAAIRSDGTLWTWGDNIFGELGQGNYAAAISSVQVPGSWTQVSAGGNGDGINYGVNPFVVAIQNDGTLWAWGDNTYGQLGMSTATVNSPTPAQIAGSWSMVVAGGQFWAGIQTNGTLWGCGINSTGLLGQHNRTSYSSPVQITAATNWTNVAVTFDDYSGEGGAIFAINSLGQLWGCGSNTRGELFQATTTKYFSSPVQLLSGTSWTQISSGGINYALGLQPGGQLFAWGLGTSGELGNGAHTNRSSPVQIAGSWSQIASGIYGTNSGSTNASFAINSQGQLFGWGTNPISGANVSSPVQISGSWAQIFSGLDAAFGINASGSLMGWGDGSWGNVVPGVSGWPEDGYQTFSSPTQIGGNWLQVSCAGCPQYTPDDPFFTLALRSDNTLWGWGANTCGQLAQANLYLFKSPVQIAGSWTQISAGGGAFNSGFGLGIQSGGSLWGWGCNDNGQIGNGATTDISSPVQISSAVSWAQVVASGNGSFAIKTDGTLWGWGDNTSGQLGALANPTITPSQIFAAQGSFTMVTAGADAYGAGGDPMLAINTQNQLWAMGNNACGELGVNSSTTAFSSPVQVAGSWTQVSTSFFGHTLAIQTNGTLWAWGSNAYGQLAQSSAVNYSSPVMVSSLSWRQCCAAGGVSYAVRSDNTLWSWGYNYDGVMGVSSLTVGGIYSSPVQIPGTWYQIAGGGSVIITSGGITGQHALGIQ